APWRRWARAAAARPAAVRGPVLLPPWRRQRTLAMAGWRHAPPSRVRAPQRGAAAKSPDGLPWRSRPRYGEAGWANSGLGGGIVDGATRFGDCTPTALPPWRRPAMPSAAPTLSGSAVFALSL